MKKIVTVTVILLVWLLQKLSIEVAEYYGVKDAALCADFVTFVNGMMGFAEANRRECWGRLCLGMINIQTKLKALQSLHSELEAKHEALSQKFDETSEQYKKSIAISERLNASNRDFKTQIEYLKSQLPPVGTAKIGMTDASKQLLQIESANTQPTTAVRSDGPKAKRSIPDFVPESEDEQPPPAKRDKSEIIIELRKKITSLVTENERLDKLFVSLKKVDVPPVENVKQPMSQEDAVKLRKANAELEAKLNSVTEEARRQAHQYTEYIKENDARWESERLEWTKRAEGLGKDAPPQIPQPSILLPSAFSLPCGSVMVCPVPIRTGRLVPLIEVYQSWVRYPADNEGTFFTSFLCPYTTQAAGAGRRGWVGWVRRSLAAARTARCSARRQSSG